MTATQQRKKLIEVALPLDEINAACKADKNRKSGTIRNLHKWFAPMPLPAWRALLFAALVDDPENDEERAKLLEIATRLVENGADLPGASAIADAKRILQRQYPEGLPLVMDPFCGGGSTLVEGQRLGLSTYGSDLNPVPALITRTLTELLPKMFGRKPLHPAVRRPVTVGERTGRAEATLDEELALIPELIVSEAYGGLGGLVRDVMHYAEQICDQAWETLHSYYPSRPSETPVAWLWARTAPCPNPVCGIETVLTTSWWLSKKKGALAWLEPRLFDGEILLEVVKGHQSGEAPAPPKAGRGASFDCLGCRQLIDESVVRSLGRKGRLGLRLVAVAVEGSEGREYRAPLPEDLAAVRAVPAPQSFLDISLGPASQYVGPPRYGLRTQADLYTPRQALVLTTIADLVAELPRKIVRDGGTEDWATSVVTLLGLAVGRMARYGSSQSQWRQRLTANAKAESVFTRNDLPMMWDFAETFFRGKSVGDWMQACASVCSSVSWVVQGDGRVERVDARIVRSSTPALIATDPPYFDAIPYADLSDYFYVWHRRALRDVHPDLYGTIATPKVGELTAFAGHHGDSREQARNYFIDGFTETFRNLERSSVAGLPMLIVYASKEQKGGSEEETRWSSILTAIVAADLQITGTWPVLGTGGSRMRGLGANAVATYVVMVCRPRPTTAGASSLADFNRALRRELRPAVHGFQAAGILPVDLAQAAMGPGMQVYSRYREVVDQSGVRVPVEQALRLINSALGEVLDEQEGELDPYSRFAVAWWEKHGWSSAPFGEADQLARPQGISVDDLVRAGVVHHPRPGFVAALGAGQMDREWTPSRDGRPTAWEAVHHLADRLIAGGGSSEAARLIGDLGTFRDPAQALVYRLHDIAARKGWVKDQERYNALIGSWSDLLAISATERDGLF